MEKNSDATAFQITSQRVVLLSCGTFSPPTYMHLRMFERARDYLKKIHGWEVIEGIMSPAADSLNQRDIVSAKHRLKMVELAVKSSSWIRADGWECSQGEWIKTIHVLHHFKKVLNRKYKNENCEIRILLLCGGDVIESITKLAVSDVMLWNTKQIEEVVRDFGVVVVIRANTDPISAIYLADVLHAYQRNIFVIEDETCPNGISSTRLRTAIRRKESIRYCTSDEVIQYIEDNSLYESTSLPAMQMKPQNICKSASLSNISTSSISNVSHGNLSKNSKHSLLPIIQTAEITEGNNQKAPFRQSLEDKKQSTVSSPIWHLSGSIPLRGKVSNVTYSLSQSQKTLRHSVPNQQCSTETNNDTMILKQFKHAHFQSADSRDYNNLTVNKSLAANINWADYPDIEKDEFSQCEDEGEGFATSQIVDMDNQSTAFQMKMSASLQRMNNGVQKKRFFASEVSRSVGNLSTELLLEKDEKSRSLPHVQSKSGNNENFNVTLIYRKYKLSSTPETTV